MEPSEASTIHGRATCLQQVPGCEDILHGMERQLERGSGIREEMSGAHKGTGETGQGDGNSKAWERQGAGDAGREDPGSEQDDSIEREKYGTTCTGGSKGRKRKRERGAVPMRLKDGSVPLRRPFAAP